MMNYSKLLVFSFSLFINLFHSQVGIGTASPHQSAILELDSNNKGLLIPRIALTSTTDNTSIVNPAVGLLVWNNGLGGLSTPGFYYWNNLKWNTISTSTSTGNPDSVGGSTWSNTGNNNGGGKGANTDLSLGTSTYDDLVFKVDGKIAGRLGVSGIDNVAFGNKTNAVGYQSVAIGANASTTANGEIAIGYKASTANQNSLAIGTESSATGQFSSAIGYNAKTSQPNAMVLGNENSNVGIGTSAPNKNVKLDVNGTYKLGTNGTVQKNVISFQAYVNPSFANVPSNKINYFDVDIPSSNLPTSLKANVVVSPSASSTDFNANFVIVNSRLLSTSKVRVYFMNINSGASSLYYADLLFSINEFY